jgi:thiamine biosynthesis lipoprotein
MQIDLGASVTEYAIDRALEVITGWFGGAALVNIAAAMASNRSPPDNPWDIGLEASGEAGTVRLYGGALVTSGGTAPADAPHLDSVDARSGDPVPEAPRSVTVSAATCLEAGMLARLAMLKGAAAESFLVREGVRHWCRRSA